MSRIALLFALLALAAPMPARSSGPDLGRGMRAEQPDSTRRLLPRWLHGSAAAGLSWMQAPHEVKARYGPGVAFDGGFWVAPAPRVRLSLEAEYLDLPSNSNGYYGTYQSSNGMTYATPLAAYGDLGNGHTIDGFGVLSMRPWRQLWIEAGTGGGYFSSGYPAVQFIDGATGDTISVPGQSGWGGAFTAGLSYEFTVRKKDHLYVSARWVRLERDTRVLHLVPLRIGYRIY